MSTPQRPASISVIERVLEEPHRFGFFQAVRLLERWFVRQENLQPGEVLEHRLKFRNSVSLAYPASEIGQFQIVEAKLDEDAMRDSCELEALAASQTRPSRSVKQIELTPAFISLLGSNGCLPNFYTELFGQRQLQHKDSAGPAFLDIFLHRAVVLFYQAWRKHRLEIRFEADRRHQFLPLVLSIAGLGHSALRDRLRADEGGVADDSLAFYAGVLQQRLTPAPTIRQVLAQYFEVPVRLEQFVGRWFMLPLDNQTRLGDDGGAPLGSGAVVGERVWQRDLRMRITLGPMARDSFHRFLPGGPAELALRELLTLMTGVTLEYEVRLSLRARDVESVRLADSHGARLGWDGFLVTRPSAEDRHDAGYDVHAVA